jgi:HPt (histidine-containing phosphotransfer) domain-containing protein
VLEVFKKDAEGRLPLFQRPPEPGDLGDLAIQAHALKSILGTIGAGELSAAAARIEAAGKAGDLDRAREALPPFAGALGALIAALGEARAAAPKEEGGEAPALGPENSARFRELAEALKGGRARAIDRLLNELGRENLAPGLRETLDRVSDLALIAEFGQAEELLRPLTGGERG